MKRLLNVISVFLLASLLWFCAGQKGQPLIQEMKDKLSILPDQSDGLAYVNVSNVFKSEFIQLKEADEFEKHLEEEEYLEFVEETGFDIKKDVHEAYFVISNSEDDDEPDFLAVVYGKFDSEKIMGYVDKKERGHELSESKYREYTIYETDESNHSFSFIENGTLIGGNDKLVKHWLDNFIDKKHNDNWINKVKRVKYKSDAYFVMNAKEFVDDVFERMGEDSNTKKMGPLKKIHSVSGSAKINSDLHFEGKGKFSDAENAELFYDAFKGLVSGAKLTMSDDRDVIDIINKLEIDLDGSVVHVSFSIDKGDIEKLASKQKLVAVR